MLWNALASCYLRPYSLTVGGGKCIKEGYRVGVLGSKVVPIDSRSLVCLYVKVSSFYLEASRSY